MAKVGRNQPCPCGSGRKARRCCGIVRGPDEEALARALVSHSAGVAAWELRHLPDAELEELFDELWELPAAALSLQVELPKFLSLELRCLCEAVAHDDPDPELLDAVAKSIDAPGERARLAHAVIAQANRGVIDERLANAALVDLGSASRLLLRAALLEAVAVETGVARTPADVQLAA